MNSNEVKRYVAIATVVLFWLLTPLYLQIKYDYSAIKVSFAITVAYYVVFKLWKRNKSERE